MNGTHVGKYLESIQYSKGTFSKPKICSIASHFKPGPLNRDFDDMDKKNHCQLAVHFV